MSKYYVFSGQLKFVIDSKDTHVAILAALQAFRGKGLMTGVEICINETGFEKTDQTQCYNTDNYLKGMYN